MSMRMLKSYFAGNRSSSSTPDHMLTQDMEFEVYSLTAGTCTAINEVAVGYESDQPTEFILEWWLNGKEMDILHGLWQFGGGRRICVGYKLAQISLSLNIAQLAYLFDYTPVGFYLSGWMGEVSARYTRRSV